MVDITSPGDTITPVTGYGEGDWNDDGGSPFGEEVENAIDNTGNKYLNFADLNSGFIVTPSVGAKVVKGLRLYTANDSPDRDPATYELWGSNDGSSFTFISSGPLNLPWQRNNTGIALASMLYSETITFSNSAAYAHYKLVFPTTKDPYGYDADSMQIGEVELLALSGPTPFVVNHVGDAPDASIGNGACATSANVCTLRAAIQEANFNAATADTITFSVTGTINLASALPNLAGPLTISGPGASSLTVRRNVTSPFRVFFINPGVTASISGLTIANGNSGFNGFGGNIANDGTLTLTDSVVTGGSAYRGGGGISSGGALTMRRTTVSNNTGEQSGGGIIGNNLTIEDSTISGNRAGFGGTEADGGGILTDGPATIKNSTISGNRADRTCAGMCGGANATLIHVTITNNRADADGNGTGFAAGYLSNSFGGNRLSNTIVAGNFTGTGSAASDMGGSVSSSSHNLIGVGGNLVNGVNNNIVGVTNPQLAPLAANGGPTQTHGLGTGSPALGAGNGFGLTTDQRGQPRPSAAGSNIGATHGLIVSLDSTPPAITPNVSGTLGNNGWHVSNVSVSWTVTDAESAVSSQTGCANSSVTSDTTGVTFTCSATSAGGNASQSVTVKRDATAPSIGASPDRPAGGAGWYNADVIVTPSYSDATSGIASSANAATLGEGASQNVSFAATDHAGNSANKSVGPFNIDKTAPVVSFGAQSPAANAAGWNNTDVSIGFTASDNLSGVSASSKASPLSFAGEGASLTDSVTVTDAAGNSQTYTSPAVKIDRTAPALSPAAATAPNAAGWYNANFQINTNATDELSGLASSTPDQTFSTEGASQTVTVTATDAAGNTASAQLAGINLDKTAPAFAPARAAGSEANSHGWNKAAVTVLANASDSLSGLASPVSNQTAAAEGASQSVSFSATDVAGNTASVSFGGIHIDTTAPSINAQRDTPANSFGWNNTDVASSYTAGDNGSGLDSPASGSYVFNAEGASQSHAFAVFDKAGNSSTTSVTGVNIDKTAPLITLTTPQNGGGYVLGQMVVAAYGCSDSLSGSNACQGTVANNGLVATDTVGVKSFAVQATDKAGNPATVTNTYTVSFGDVALHDMTRAAKAGSTLPIKLQVTNAAGQNLSSPTLVVTALAVVKLSDYAPGDVAAMADSTPDENFKFTDDRYQFNLRTTGLTTGTYVLIYSIGGDPRTHALQFQIK